MFKKIFAFAAGLLIAAVSFAGDVAVRNVASVPILVSKAGAVSAIPVGATRQFSMPQGETLTLIANTTMAGSYYVEAWIPLDGTFPSVYATPAGSPAVPLMRIQPQAFSMGGIGQVSPLQIQAYICNDC